MAHASVNLVVSCTVLIYALFVMKFLTAIFILFSTWLLITSSSDLQPSTAIANQLPDQLVSSQIRSKRVKLFLIHHNIDSVQDIDCINR